MQKGIIGKKLGMTQIFDEKGNVIPVTVIEAGPCVIAQKKTVETDGYNAVQMGFGDIKLKYRKGKKSDRSEKFQEKPSNITLAQAGHFAKSDLAPKKYLREFRFDSIDSLNVGDIIKATTFAAGDKVDVVGTSKGRNTHSGHTGAHRQPQRTPSAQCTTGTNCDRLSGSMWLQMAQAAAMP